MLAMTSQFWFFKPYSVLYTLNRLLILIRLKLFYFFCNFDTTAFDAPTMTVLLNYTI